RPTPDQRPFVLLSLAGVAGAAAATLSLWTWKGPGSVLGGMIAADRFAVYFRLVILAAAALGILLSSYYLDRAGEARGEYYPLLLFATAGMTLITAASDLILIFLALEILSLSLYLLTGFSFRRLASAEASMKYFLLGAFSSAFFLYGIAFAYGATATTNLSAIAVALVSRTNGDALALIAVGLLAVGFSFKIAAVPFHMWTPDAYQGAPTCVTAFMSAGTKVAAFGAFLRVFGVAFLPLAHDWQPFMGALAGIPPMAGFIAKVSVFSAAVQAGSWPLVLIAVLASVAAAFFYIRVIVLMYMQDPAPEIEGVRIESDPAGWAAVLAPAFLTVVFGVLPGLLFGLLRTASVVRF